MSKRSVPIFVGTELNKYGQKLVDDFDSKYLDPFTSYFRKRLAVVGTYGFRTLLEGVITVLGLKRHCLIGEEKHFFALLGKNIPADREVIKKLERNPPRPYQRIWIEKVTDNCLLCL